MSHTPHFFSQALTDQVYAALAQDGGAAISNAGVIDLGGLTVIFDTFLTLQAARDLRSFAEKATGRSPQIVINSHFHNDHIWGNQVFLPEAQFVSTNENSTIDNNGRNGRVPLVLGEKRPKAGIFTG